MDCDNNLVIPYIFYLNIVPGDDPDLHRPLRLLVIPPGPDPERSPGVPVARVLATEDVAVPSGNNVRTLRRLGKVDL